MAALVLAGCYTPGRAAFPEEVDLYATTLEVYRDRRPGADGVEWPCPTCVRIVTEPADFFCDRRDRETGLWRRTAESCARWAQETQSRTCALIALRTWWPEQPPEEEPANVLEDGEAPFAIVHEAVHLIRSCEWGAWYYRRPGGHPLEVETRWSTDVDHEDGELWYGHGPEPAGRESIEYDAWRRAGLRVPGD